MLKYFILSRFVCVFYAGVLGPTTIKNSKRARLKLKLEKKHL